MKKEDRTAVERTLMERIAQCRDYRIAAARRPGTEYLGRASEEIASHPIYGRSPSMGAITSLIAEQNEVLGTIPWRNTTPIVRSREINVGGESRNAGLWYISWGGEVVNFMGHTLDGFTYDREMVRPEKETDLPISLPEHIAHEGFVARLLTTDLQVFEEALAMKHCLYRAYTRRMETGEYAAYHLSAPNPIKTGGGMLQEFTIGVKKEGKEQWIPIREERFNLDPVTRELAPEIPASTGMNKKKVFVNSWRVDQIRGIKNACMQETAADRFLKFFIEEINR